MKLLKKELWEVPLTKAYSRVIEQVYRQVIEQVYRQVDVRVFEQGHWVVRLQVRLQFTVEN